MLSTLVGEHSAAPTPLMLHSQLGPHTDLHRLHCVLHVSTVWVCTCMCVWWAEHSAAQHPCAVHSQLGPNRTWNSLLCVSDALSCEPRLLCVQLVTRLML